MPKTINDIIEDFVEATVHHRQAISVGNWREANKNAKKIHKAFLYIVKNGPEAREALLAQTNSENNQVALMAATYSLKYNPKKALTVLRHNRQ